MSELIHLIVMALAGVGLLVLLGIFVDLGMRRDAERERRENGDVRADERWD